MDNQNNNRIYSLDSSALINLEVYYPQKLFPKLWEKLAEEIKKGRLYVIDKVYGELQEKDDIVGAWLKEMRSDVRRTFPNSLMPKVYDIIRTFPKLIDINNPKEQADPYLVAYAESCGSIIVTSENRIDNANDPKRKKDKVPNVCEHYGVEYINNISRRSVNEFALRLFDELGFEELG